jgi:hypothetical protein
MPPSYYRLREVASVVSKGGSMSQSIRGYFDSIIERTDDALKTNATLEDYRVSIFNIRQAARAAIQQMDKPPRRPQQQTALDLD